MSNSKKDVTPRTIFTSIIQNKDPMNTVLRDKRRRKVTTPSTSQSLTKFKAKEKVQMSPSAGTDVTPRTIFQSISNNKHDMMNTIKPDRRRRKVSTPLTSRKLISKKPFQKNRCDEFSPMSIEKNETLPPLYEESHSVYSSVRKHRHDALPSIHKKSHSEFESLQKRSNETLPSKREESYSEPVSLKKRRRSVDIRKKLKPVADVENLREELFEKMLQLRQAKNIETSRQTLLEAVSKSSRMSENDVTLNERSLDLGTQESSIMERSPRNAPVSVKVASPRSSGIDVADMSKRSSATKSVRRLARKSIRQSLSSRSTERLQNSKLNETNLSRKKTPKQNDVAAGDGAVPLTPAALDASSEKSVAVTSTNHSIELGVAHKKISSDVVLLSDDNTTSSSHDPLQLHSSFQIESNDDVPDDEPSEVSSSVLPQVSPANPSNTNPTNSVSIKAKPQKETSVKKTIPTLNKLYLPSKNRQPTTPRKSFVSQSQMKGILEHYSNLKFTKEAVIETEKIFMSFFKHLCVDMSAMSDLAGRSTINRSDMELIMKRQRLITDEMSLHVLIEETLPLEYREKLLPCAKASIDETLTDST